MSAHELDHLAIAVPSWESAGALLNRELGAQWASGFPMEVFSPCQLAVAQDMRLELLAPGSGKHSFIQRFLADNNQQPAPHHITFKVHDIRGAIAGAQAAGIEPILVNLEHPQWQEAFLHPKDTGLGFLAQMVQAPQSIEELTGSLDNGLPCPWEQPEGTQRNLPVIYGTVASLERARHVLVRVLGAREIAINPAQLTVLFRWDEGADLLLTQGPAVGDNADPPAPRRSGIQGIVSTPADQPWHVEEHLEELPGLFAGGTAHPELGLSIASVAHVPAAYAP